MRIHDISIPLSDATVPWQGVTVPWAHQEFFVDVRRGDPVTGSWWSLNTHAGTHVDTPTHLFPDGPDAASTGWEHYLGPCVVVDVGDVESEIRASDLAGMPALRDHRRVLFRTANSRRDLWGLDRFEPDYVAVGADAARLAGGARLPARGHRLPGHRAVRHERLRDPPDPAPGRLHDPGGRGPARRDRPASTSSSACRCAWSRGRGARSARSSWRGRRPASTRSGDRERRVVDRRPPRGPDAAPGARGDRRGGAHRARCGDGAPRRDGAARGHPPTGDARRPAPARAAAPHPLRQADGRRRHLPAARLVRPPGVHRGRPGRARPGCQRGHVRAVRP